MIIAIPEIRTVPLAYTSGQNSALAARLALAMAGDGDIRRPRRLTQTIELDVLQLQLRAWLGRMNAGAKFIKPRIHLSLNALPEMGSDDPEDQDDVYTVWISDEPHELVGAVWTLEKRWMQLEQKAPGIAAVALNALDHAGRHSFPLYTPNVAEYWGSRHWWWGEDDETYILEEYRAEIKDPKAPPPDDMPTRAWLDKVLPRCATRPANRVKSAGGLERLARRRDDVGEIARLVIEIGEANAASHRRKSSFEFSSQDENGFMAVGYSSCLRWNSADPMLQIYDDYVNEIGNDAGCEDAYGWFVMDKARELPLLLKELEHYFAIARKIERLIPLVATRLPG